MSPKLSVVPAVGRREVAPTHAAVPVVGNDRGAAVALNEPVEQRAAAVAASVPLSVIAANRMGFGPSPQWRRDWAVLGSTDEQRLQAYIDQQLDPDSIDDSDYETRRAAAGYTTLDKSLVSSWTDHHAENKSGGSNRRRPINESEMDVFLRAVHSKRQLQEVMVEFWLNHFNVYGWDYWSQPVWAHWVRTMRTNAFGRFRYFLGLVAQHPAMLYYLDNYTSSNAGPNENFSRELFELHTLGAENYMGVVPWQDVPKDAAGRPIAYVDGDVFEATRCFTGWSVANGYHERPNNGLFHYEADHHDRFQKIVLGQFLPADQPPERDGYDVLDALANHPGTARHIARKLCRRLISDDPPESLVQRAADEFFAHRQASDQIARTLRVVLESDEFKTTWAEKVKRPFDLAVGSMRATNTRLDFKDDADDLNKFFWRFERTGHSLFSWHTPDGYPDMRDAWESTAPRVMTWRLILWLSDTHSPDERHRMDVLAEMNTSKASASEAADFWINRILMRPMGTEARQEIVNFMAQGYNPDLQLDLDDRDTQDRLRTMVTLILNSVQFSER